MSILLTKFDYTPFSQIKNSNYLSSIEIAIKELKSEIELIIDNKKGIVLVPFFYFFAL